MIMKVFDYFDKDEEFIIPRKTINNLIGQDTRDDEAEGNTPYFNPQNKRALETIEKTYEALNLDKDISPVEKVVVTAISLMDYFENIRMINNDDYVKVDILILIGLEVEKQMIKQGFEYEEEVISEFEQKFLMALAELYGFKTKKMISLFAERKEYFLQFLLKEDYEKFIKETALLLANDIAEDFFSEFNADSATVVPDSFEQIVLLQEFSTVFAITKGTIEKEVELITDIEFKNKKEVELVAETEYKIEKEVELITETESEGRIEDTPIEEVPKLFCRKCGKQIPYDSEYCMFCGERILHDFK